ncbi:MAG: hypothetical protein P4K80_04970 [Acidobacteriaceae bacterium]|nr:hypothetical protein [Acidobacteriaceae bacterium]
MSNSNAVVGYRDVAAGNGDADLVMVVLQFGGRTIKGHAERGQWLAVEGLGTGLATTVIRPLGTDHAEEVSLEGVKAIFFVKSFDGKWHDDLRFHDHLPTQECLWVRATFADGEVIEGLIHNTQSYVVNSGFYMSPTDPEGNNWLIYVLKNKLKDFQVLGLRAAPKTMLGLKPLENLS